MLENRVLIFPITWEIIKDLIVDKIVGLPKDINIVGITRDGRNGTELIGIRSDEFKNTPLGELVPEVVVSPVYNSKGKVIKIKYMK